jgi:hypothetical protein
MCGRRMLVGSFTVLVRRSCMLLCLRVLANGVVVLGLMMVMCSGVMMGRGQVMMLLGGVLCFLCHLTVPPFFS